MSGYDRLMDHLVEHGGHMHIYTTVDPAKWWVEYAWETDDAEWARSEGGGDTLEIAMGLVVMEVVGA